MKEKNKHKGINIYFVWIKWHSHVFLFDQNDSLHVPNRHFELFDSDFDNALHRQKKNNWVQWNQITTMYLQYKQHIYSDRQFSVELIVSPILVEQLVLDTFQVMVFESQQYVHVYDLEAILKNKIMLLWRKILSKNYVQVFKWFEWKRILYGSRS